MKKPEINKGMITPPRFIKTQEPSAFSMGILMKVPMIPPIMINARIGSVIECFSKKSLFIKYPRIKPNKIKNGPRKRI
jgi:hypothetical protein